MAASADECWFRQSCQKPAPSSCACVRSATTSSSSFPRVFLLGLGRLVGAPLPEDVLEVGLLEVAAPALLEAEADLPFRLEDLVDEHGPGVAVAAHLRLVLAGRAERGEGERYLL